MALLEAVVLQMVLPVLILHLHRHLLAMAAALVAAAEALAALVVLVVVAGVLLEHLLPTAAEAAQLEKETTVEKVVKAAPLE